VCVCMYIYMYVYIYVCIYIYIYIYIHTQFLFNINHYSAGRNSWRFLAILIPLTKQIIHNCKYLYKCTGCRHLFISVNYPNLRHSSLISLLRKPKSELTFFVLFSISAISPRHNSDISPFKITKGSHCTSTQITTQLSAGPIVSSQFLSVRCLLLSHQKLSSVNDCPQMIHSVSCCVSVTVCSFLLCPVVCQ